MIQNTRSWKEVPLNCMSEWMNTFYKSKEGINLSIECPICDLKQLHRYYDSCNNIHRIIDGNNFIGTGDLWEWCSSCYHFSRCYAAIPDWWNCHLEIDQSETCRTPEFLEIAIRKKSLFSN